MTDATTAAAPMRRPSPRPRPAGAPGRAQESTPRLRVVPPQVSDPEVPTSDLAGGVAPETITAGQSGSTTKELPAVSESDFRDRVARIWASTCVYWTPPRLYTDRPASLAELRDYANAAPWTAQTTGPIRTAGVWWYRGVAYPQTVRHRYAEWVWQRPGRFIAHAAVLKLAASTTPGIWVVDHLIYPAARIAGHIFL